jgi:hypothetical protein
MTPTTDSAVSPVRELSDPEMTWRDLALQFDAHRIDAICIIRGMLASNSVKHDCGAAEFLAAPPLSGEKVLAERLNALSRRSLDTADGVEPGDWLLAAQTFLGADDFAAMRSLAEAFAKDRQAGVNSQLKSAGQS